ncbi:phytanoyl-CoA dioxygenase family protein [Corallococcus sp. bb12-1]|uniref:phytanoyl-CoA dioxygenase family protein n=1 Tax=Corallococcus sp. bb12-1 TaxID=2996784 RepID=UPI0022701603|nr:phytanoyl-CoA dioxygenase family protein [Corallococcus sp. bb12-1]MCY1040580.1 phytanoyl-CoA dioxygenase family protein [Corallococcus sp. bb12-1]
MTSELNARIEREGFAILPHGISTETVEALLQALHPVSAGATPQRRGGVRNLLEDVPAVRELARAAPVREAAEAVLGSHCFAVRGLLFDKTPDANWKVLWHQDLTIAVRERCDVPGFGSWSEKAGVPCVQPPTEVLEDMVAVRVHLDDCGEDNGPVRILAGSHREGRLSAALIPSWLERTEPQDCVVPRGGLLVMRPLLLHASSPARVPAHRRVIHLEFATRALPGGLEWHARA